MAGRHFPASLASGFLVSALFASSPVHAYCRATTCDPDEGPCDTDVHGCFTEGPHLYWTNGRVRLSVDDGGSVLRDISGDDAIAAVSEALSAWTEVACNAQKEHPSIDAATALIKAGATAKFNSSGPNESVVLYRDDAWPYGNKAVAKTTLGFELDTGRILDADIQLNSDSFDLAVGPDAGQTDVVAVLTHEIGHVLGLGHTDVDGATMQPEVRGFGTAGLRTLEPDDVDGICAIYPPASKTDEPAAAADDGEYVQTTTGCSFAPAPRAPSTRIAFVVAAVACIVRRRKE